MTNSWTDIRNTDLVVIMGGNAAEAHPCGFKWVTEAKANRGAKLIVIDPRFTRSASVADFYAPIRQGTDIAFLLGLINYCIQNNKVHWDYVKTFTNATYMVKEGFSYQDGLFNGYDEAKRDYTDKANWEYLLGQDNYVVTDESLQRPHCVWNLLKQHVAVYTPEMVVQGIAGFVGSDLGRARQEVETHRQVTRPRFNLKVTPAGQVSVQLPPELASQARRLTAVVYGNAGPVHVLQGENRGETMTGAFAVRKLIPVPTLSQGHAQLSILPLPAASPTQLSVAVLVEGPAAAILAVETTPVQ